MRATPRQWPCSPWGAALWGARRARGAQAGRDGERRWLGRPPSAPVNGVNGPPRRAENGRNLHGGDPQRSPWQGNLHYRRCSQRQGGGEPLVSEWFVSEGRLDHWAYQSSPRRWRCSLARICSGAPADATGRVQWVRQPAGSWPWPSGPGGCGAVGVLADSTGRAAGGVWLCCGSGGCLKARDVEQGCRSSGCGAELGVGRKLAGGAEGTTQLPVLPANLLGRLPGSAPVASERLSRRAAGGTQGARQGQSRQRRPWPPALGRSPGLTRFRWVPTDQVIDWAAIQPFGIEPGGVRLRTPTAALRRLRPGELADLLEDLERPLAKRCWPTWTPPPPPMR